MCLVGLCYQACAFRLALYITIISIPASIVFIYHLALYLPQDELLILTPEAILQADAAGSILSIYSKPELIIVNSK